MTLLGSLVGLDNSEVFDMALHVHVVQAADVWE